MLISCRLFNDAEDFPRVSRLRPQDLAKLEQRKGREERCVNLVLCNRSRER